MYARNQTAGSAAPVATSAGTAARRLVGTVAGPVAGLVAGTIASTLSADFVTTRYTSGSSYHLQINDMPDLDQQRDGLGASSSGTPGGMYCVPTATANLFAYIAQNGYAGVMPGNYNWTLASNYGRGTDFIKLLGTIMGTSATDGTSNSSAYTAAMILLGLNLGDFTVEAEFWSSSNTVSLREMARAGINTYAIQQFCYGRYDVLGTNGCGETVIERMGGHCLTLTGALRSGTSRTIRFRDPWASDGDTSAQGTYATTSQESPWMSNLLVHDSLSGCPRSPQGFNAIETGAGDDLLRLIDSRVSIRPKSCYSWMSTGFLPGVALTRQGATWTDAQGGIRQAASNGWSWGTLAGAQLTLSPSGVPFLVVPGANGVILAEQPTDNGTVLVPVDLGVLGLPPIDEAVFAADRTLVVRAGRMLYAVAGLDAGAPDDEAAGDADNAPFVAWSAELPFDAAKIVAAHRGQVDPEVGRFLGVIAFNANMRLAYEVSGDPAQAPKYRSVPVEVPLDPDPPDVAGTTIIEDSIGTLWFAQKGAKQVAGLLSDGQVVIEQLPVDAITGFAIDDRDNLLVVDSGVVRCFSHSPQGLVETGAQNSIFAGMQVGNGFAVERSTSNFEPRFHATPGWRDVIDAEQGPAPCIGDVNGDGAVNGSDMAMVLGAWGSTATTTADINGDGIVNGADLAQLLGAWGACP
jgi:hypothetical protein